MKFVDEVKGLWREAGTFERIVLVVTAPLLVAAYWIAYVFSTDDVD